MSGVFEAAFGAVSGLVGYGPGPSSGGVDVVPSVSGGVVSGLVAVWEGLAGWAGNRRAGDGAGAGAGAGSVGGVQVLASGVGVRHVWVGLAPVVGVVEGVRVGRGGVAVVHGVGVGGGLADGVVERLVGVVEGLKAVGVSELVVLACGQVRARELASVLGIRVWATTDDVLVSADGRVLFGAAELDGQHRLRVVTRAEPLALVRFDPPGEVVAPAGDGAGVALLVGDEAVLGPPVVGLTKQAAEGLVGGDLD